MCCWFSRKKTRKSFETLSPHNPHSPKSGPLPVGFSHTGVHHHLSPGLFQSPLPDSAPPSFISSLLCEQRPEYSILFAIPSTIWWPACLSPPQELFPWHGAHVPAASPSSLHCAHILARITLLLCDCLHPQPHLCGQTASTELPHQRPSAGRGPFIHLSLNSVGEFTGHPLMSLLAFLYHS